MMRVYVLILYHQPESQKLQQLPSLPARDQRGKPVPEAAPLETASAGRSGLPPDFRKTEIGPAEKSLSTMAQTEPRFSQTIAWRLGGPASGRHRADERHKSGCTDQLNRRRRRHGAIQ